jgi:hypothetical protein
VKRELIMLAAAGLVVASSACGGDDTVAEPTSPVATTDAAAPEVTPFSEGEPVDLVYIADSSSVGERYAELATEILDREVRLNGGIDEDPQLIRTTHADEVADAEIIVFFFNSGQFELDMPAPNFSAGCLDSVAALELPDWDGPPWTPGTKWEPVPVVPTDDDWQPYRDWLSEIWEAIWDARDGQPVVLRGHDVYNPWYGQWVELGVEPECTAIWEGQTRAARDAAEANGATFVSFYDVFNGPGHDEDARLKGWIDDDGMHANDAGQMVAAEALAAVGFEPNERPG